MEEEAGSALAEQAIGSERSEKQGGVSRLDHAQGKKMTQVHGNAALHKKRQKKGRGNTQMKRYEGQGKWSDVLTGLIGGEEEKYQGRKDMHLLRKLVSKKGTKGKKKEKGKRNAQHRTSQASF